MATDALIEAVEATVLKLEAGDILFLQLPEDAISEPAVVESTMRAVERALDITGHTQDVAVLLTADSIKLTVVRADADGD